MVGGLKMGKFPEPVGRGGLWLKEAKSGVKYMDGEMMFSYNGHEVSCKIAVFKNTKKEPGSKYPDYNLIVNDAAPAKAREPKSGGFTAKPGEYSGKEKEEDDIVPF